MKIYGRAPTRIDLAGGTLDIWPIWLFHPGAVTVNVAINRWAEVSLETTRSPAIRIESRDTGKKVTFPNSKKIHHNHSLPLLSRVISFFEPKTGFILRTETQAPPGAGLAGSSALNIALCGVFNRLAGSTYRKRELLTIAQNIEAKVLGIPTGIQDYYPALFGGVNAIWLTETGGERELLNIPPAEIENRLLLCYSGRSRNSGQVNWKVMKKHLDGDQRTRNRFETINQSSQKTVSLLSRNRFSEIGKLLRKEWKARESLGLSVVNKKISDLYLAGIREGAESGRVCGAGGGGCMFFLCRPDRTNRISRRLTALGITVLPFRVSKSGLTVRVER